MSKAMTYEEWREIHDDGQEFIARRQFDDARVGMIPEDGAVRIPDVGEWPSNADAVWIGYTQEYNFGEVIRIINRPVPVWVPKKNDLVFFLDTESIYKVERIDSNRNFHLFGGAVAKLEELKEGDASKIGKPWGEI